MLRRLAAIMAADVVGFAHLMEQDEAGTLATLKAHRKEMIEPRIVASGGRIVKLMGDGALVEFASVVGAGDCAIGIQGTMIERNASVAEGQRVTFASASIPQEIGGTATHIFERQGDGGLKLKLHTFN